MPARKTSAAPAPKAAPSRKLTARGDAIAAWSRAQSPAHRATCDALRNLIESTLPRLSSKLWHGAPVWFEAENPVVGYSVKKQGVSLLFWNGMALKEPGLTPVGQHGAAEALFRDEDDPDEKVVRRWLKKAGANVLDSVTCFRKLREKR